MTITKKDYVCIQQWIYNPWGLTICKEKTQRAVGQLNNGLLRYLKSP